MALDAKHGELATRSTVMERARGLSLGPLAWATASFGVLIGLWALSAWLIANPIMLPSPAAVLETLMREYQNGELFRHVGATLMRVAISFVIAMLLGTAIGIALGRSKVADNFFGNWLIFFLNLPALVTIVLCYVWMGQTEVAAILAVTINKIPNVAILLRDGARNLSRDLDEMATVFKFSWWQTFRHVTLPQLAPFLAGAARSGLSLVWKIVLVVELFGLQEGVGVQIQTAFQLFDVATILAYTIAFIAVVQAIEFGILQPLDKWVNRWRR